MPYFRRTEITPDTDKVGQVVEILYETATGHMITWAPKLKIYRGEQAELDAGRWNILTQTLNARDILELGAGDVEIAGNAIARKDAFIIEEPSRG